MSKLRAIDMPRAASGIHLDGDGLRLVVKRSGARSWVLRYQIDKRSRDMGLGRFPDVSLAMAREKALEARRRIKADKIPRWPSSKSANALPSRPLPRP